MDSVFGTADNDGKYSGDADGVDEHDGDTEGDDGIVATEGFDRSPFDGGGSNEEPAEK